MATNRNIQMNYYNGTDYDVLYPQSTIAQISNLQNTLNSKLNLSGGTMTGNLTLNGDPSSGLQAVTKQYVDNNITSKIDGVIELLASYVLSGTNSGLTFSLDADVFTKCQNSNMLYIYGYFGGSSTTGNRSISFSGTEIVQRTGSEIDNIVHYGMGCFISKIPNTNLWISDGGISSGQSGLRGNYPFEMNSNTVYFSYTDLETNYFFIYKIK